MKKFVKFIKPHFSGLKEGDIRKVDTALMNRFTKEGLAEEITEEEYNALKNGETVKEVKKAKRTRKKKAEND